jgi:hypothetical protein
MAGLVRATLLVAAVAMLGGCTGGTAGKADGVLGDLATIEPCGLTDPEVFAEFGAAEFGPPESLGYCTVVVTPGASGTDSFRRQDAEEVTIMVGDVLRPSDDIPFLPTEKLEDVGDGIHTTRPKDTDVSCWQTLVFAEDDLALSVRSRMSPTAGPTPTCDMVAAGMAKVVEVVTAGQVGHRSPAPNSLVSLDPCDLVADEVITALPGFAGARRVASVDRHTCVWRDPADASAPRAKVTFGVDGPPGSRHTPGADVGPVAGRPMVVTRSGRTCTVETRHIPFEDAAGAPGFVESVAVDVETPGGFDESAADDEVCAGARAVAEALWPRLPGA